MYKIVFTSSAEKELVKLPQKDGDIIFEKIEKLAINPRPVGVKKLENKIGLWRVRIGNYRVVYSISDKQLLIEIIRIAHRKDIYRNI
jgi:mRNA interferase RelE/StbE